MERAWVHDVLSADVDLAALVGARIFQGESLDSAPKTKPFLIWRFGNTSPDNDVPQARRQYVTLYAHDEAKPGEYSRIDKVQDAAIKAMVTAGLSHPAKKANKIVAVRFLELSADFDDREMGTILRYSRFQIVLAEWLHDFSEIYA